MDMKEQEIKKKSMTNQWVGHLGSAARMKAGKYEPMRH